MQPQKLACMTVSSKPGWLLLIHLWWRLLRCISLPSWSKSLPFHSISSADLLDYRSLCEWVHYRVSTRRMFNLSFRHILTNVGRVAARDSSRTSATIQDLFTALCEDDSVYGLFRSMKGAHS